MEATIKFTYVEKYPDEPPLWEIHSQENLEDSDAEDILTLLQQQVGPHGQSFWFLVLPPSEQNYAALEKMKHPRMFGLFVVICQKYYIWDAR